MQETLLEAWHHAEQLRDPERRAQWLFGIARNVFLRWARQRARDLPARSVDDPDAFGEAGDDVELEVERHELADLLDQALGMLPAETGGVLAARYGEDLPPGAIAERLGISEGAVTARLHRGIQAGRAPQSGYRESQPSGDGGQYLCPVRLPGAACPRSSRHEHHSAPHAHQAKAEAPVGRAREAVARRPVWPDRSEGGGTLRCGAVPAYTWFQPCLAALGRRSATPGPYRQNVATALRKT